TSKKKVPYSALKANNTSDFKGRIKIIKVDATEWIPPKRSETRRIFVPFAFTSFLEKPHPALQSKGALSQITKRFQDLKSQKKQRVSLPGMQYLELHDVSDSELVFERHVAGIYIRKI